MQRNEGVMANVIVHVLNVGDLRGEEYWSQQPQNIALGGLGNEYRPFVSLAL